MCVVAPVVVPAAVAPADDDAVLASLSATGVVGLAVIPVEESGLQKGTGQHPPALAHKVLKAGPGTRHCHDNDEHDSTISNNGDNHNDGENNNDKNKDDNYPNDDKDDDDGGDDDDDDDDINNNNNNQDNDGDDDDHNGSKNKR